MRVEVLWNNTDVRIYFYLFQKVRAIRVRTPSPTLPLRERNNSKITDYWQLIFARNTLEEKKPAYIQHSIELSWN